MTQLARDTNGHFWMWFPSCLRSKSLLGKAFAVEETINKRCSKKVQWGEFLFKWLPLKVSSNCHQKQSIFLIFPFLTTKCHYSLWQLCFEDEIRPKQSLPCHAINVHYSSALIWTTLNNSL